MHARRNLTRQRLRLVLRPSDNLEPDTTLRYSSDALAEAALRAAPATGKRPP
jgi:hypothetical protein